MSHAGSPHDAARICLVNIIVSYVGGEQLRTSMKATSLPSSTVHRSTGEDNIIVF